MSFWGGVKALANPFSSPLSPIGQARNLLNNPATAVNPFSQIRQTVNPFRSSGQQPQRNIVPGYEAYGAQSFPLQSFGPPPYQPPPVPYSPLGTSQGYDWGQPQFQSAAPAFDWSQYQAPPQMWDTGDGTGWEAAYGQG